VAVGLEALVCVHSFVHGGWEHTSDVSWLWLTC
jgi:hypothetical protein